MWRKAWLSTFHIFTLHCFQLLSISEVFSVGCNCQGQLLPCFGEKQENATLCLQKNLPNYVRWILAFDLMFL